MPKDVLEQLNAVYLYMRGLEALIEEGKVIAYRLPDDDEPSAILANDAEHVHRVNQITVGELRRWHDERLQQITHHLLEEGENDVP